MSEYSTNYLIREINRLWQAVGGWDQDKIRGVYDYDCLDAIIAKLRAADKLYETSKKIADWLKGFEGARLSYLEAQLHDGFKKDIADYGGAGGKA
jgi:hypothetical protein